MEKIEVSIQELHEAVDDVIDKCRKDKETPDMILGISRGGLMLAQFLGYALNVKTVETIRVQLNEEEDKNTYSPFEKLVPFLKELLVINGAAARKKYSILVVDDLLDTGKTFVAMKNLIKTINDYDFNIEFKFATLYVKPLSYKLLTDQIYFSKKLPDRWVVFPWDIV